MAWTCVAVALWNVAAAAAVAGAPNGSMEDARQPEANQPADWRVLETPSFLIRCDASRPEAQRLADRCESLRRQLQEKWLGNEAARWSPRCELTVHATRDGYLRAVGAEAAQTQGASYIEVRGGRIVARKLDLLADEKDGEPIALPHELTHVVLADRFRHGRLPPWADEGMAVLADPPEKRRLHERDRQSAEAAGLAIGLEELVSMRTCPCGNRCAAFYGQSAAIVEYLTQREKPERFVEFVEQAMRIGHDAALRRVYGIQGIRELERASRSAGPRTGSVFLAGHER